MEPEERGKLRNIICIILSVIILAVLGYLYVVYQQRETAYFTALEEQQEEAEPYEEELRSLKSELASMENDYVYSAEKAGLMVGFVISGTVDLEYIKELKDKYTFTPVLVLDCVMEQEELQAIVEAADESWEIMLYATAFSEAVNDDVLSVLSWLESAGRTQTGVFLLRREYCSNEVITLLEEDGFAGYTLYTESTPTAGQVDDGAVYFDYSYVTTSATTVMESRLSASYNAKTFMIVVFDMASLNSGSLPEYYVQELLDVMRTYAEKDDCDFVTVAEAVEELSHVNEKEAQYYAEYEERIAETQDRIAELNEIIAGIYER